MANSSLTRPWLRALAASLILLLAFAGIAGAKKKKDDDESSKQFTVTEAVAKKLTKAQEAIAEEQWALALEELGGLKKKADKGRMHDHERALVYQFLFFVSAGQSKYEESLVHLESCLKQDALPKATMLGMMYNAAQIYLAIEDYPGAVKALKRWFRATDKRSPAAYYLLSVAYYQQSLLDKALRPAKKAVDIAEKPNQAWLQMLVGLYLQKGDYAAALPHVEVLVATFPKKVYYTQLSALYNQLDEEEKSLAIMQLAYEQGFLTLDRELVRLGEMFQYHGQPYRAAVVLTQGLEEEKIEPDAKSLELLANCWLLARENERAVAPLLQAAEMSETGDVYMRLGQVYLERDNYEAAADALVKGLEREIKREGDAHLLLGITYYNLQKTQSARRSFRAARKFDNSKDPAVQWLQMLDRDAKRAAQNAS